MDSKMQEPHGFLKSLYWQLKAFEPNHPSHDDLQKLGIQVSQVATVKDETILFDPCFFLPHTDTLLQKYPVETDPDSEGTTKPPRLNAVPTFDQLLEECQDLYSNPEEVLKEATYHFEQYQESQCDKNWYLQGLIIQRHIDWQLHAPRNIQPEICCLWDLGGQKVFL